MKSARVGIIGAGLAGLNAARALNRAGIDNEIYEASDRIGGRVTSDLIDGYICDRGFQVINPAYSELLETGIAEGLGIRALPKGARIHLNGMSILVVDPRASLRYWSGDLSRRSGSLLEKLHFFQYLMAKTEDLTFSAAMNDCGGFFDDILSPFLTGVFLTSPSEMSNQMARELIHWFVKGRPGLPQGGVKRLPELLADGAKIHLNAKVELLANRSMRVNGRSEEFDAIIVETTGLADPAPVAQTFFVDEDVSSKARLDADRIRRHDAARSPGSASPPEPLRKGIRGLTPASHRFNGRFGAPPASPADEPSACPLPRTAPSFPRG